MPHSFSKYACQISLPGYGDQGQELLGAAKVLIVGAGGLGCPAAQYLVAAGTGTVGIADHDTVSLGNLHRQILFTPADIDKNKALTAAQRLAAQNPDCHIIVHDHAVTVDNALEIIAHYDLVLDCTDNFETRYLLNDACYLSGKPLVYAAIYQYEGQVTIWNAPNPGGSRSANYRDLFPDVNASAIPNCSEGGVLSTLAGMIGCMQANEAIKYITMPGDALIGKILILDARTMASRIIKTPKVTQTNITCLAVPAVITTISAKELRHDLSAYELIDVRTADEHKFFNIGGRNIPLSRIADNLSYLALDKPIVFYCATGQRSAEAVKMIRKRFDADIYSLEGGLKGWV